MIAIDAGSSLHVGVLKCRNKLRDDFSHHSYVGLGELEFVGVDKTCLYECAGLASAFAVVFGIDEAAVVAEILIEIAARAGEDLPEIDRGHLAYVGSNFVADLEDFAKDEDKALAAVEAEQGSDSAVVAGLFIQDVDWNWDGSGVGRVEIGDLAESGGGDGEGTNWVGGVPLGFPDAEQMIDGDAIEPGAEPGLAAKAGEGLDGFEEDLLSSVFGIGAAMEHVKGEVEEPRKMRSEQQFELFGVA